MKNSIISALLVFALDCGGSPAKVTDSTTWASSSSTGTQSSTGSPSSSNSTSSGSSSDGSTTSSSVASSSGTTGATSSGGSTSGGVDAGWMPGDAGWSQTDAGLSCTPDSTNCENPTTEVICKQDGSSTREVACPNGCNGTSCNTCQPGFSQCSGRNVSECNLDGHTESTVQTCQYGCNQTTVFCYPTCSPSSSEYQALDAGYGEVVICNGDGTAFDGGSSSCPFGGQNTDAGPDCYLYCPPASLACLDDGIEACDSNGAGYDVLAATCNDHCGAGLDGGITCDYCTDPSDCFKNQGSLPLGLNYGLWICLNNLCVSSEKVTCETQVNCPVDTTCVITAGQDAGTCEVTVCNPADGGTCRPFVMDPNFGVEV